MRFKLTTSCACIWAVENCCNIDKIPYRGNNPLFKEFDKQEAPPLRVYVADRGNHPKLGDWVTGMMLYMETKDCHIFFQLSRNKKAKVCELISDANFPVTMNFYSLEI